jgi:hypothetical protein
LQSTYWHGCETITRVLEGALKRTIVFLLLCSFLFPENGENFALSQEPNQISPRAKLLIIDRNSVSIPVGKILLIRKESTLLALKLIHVSPCNSKADEHAQYECYSLVERKAGFNNSNVKMRNGEVSSKMRGFGRLAFQFGNPEIQCGPLRLYWSGENKIVIWKESLDPTGYNIEFSPTNWDDISEIDMLDPRIRWVGYDPNRDMKPYFIDQYWEEMENGK